MQVYGDFVMTTHVRFMHVNEGDQAGLMVRLNSDCWLKAAVTNHPPGEGQWPSFPCTAVRAPDTAPELMFVAMHSVDSHRFWQAGSLWL